MPLSQSPFSAHTQKYWERRHTLFARWDEGIATDEEGLFSVKPEAFALETAHALHGNIILDAFCGIGGSAIGFTRAGKQVLSVDLHAGRLKMAHHNATLLGVAERITFIQGDILTLYDQLTFDALNLDPPWGGTDYDKKENFD